MALGDNCQKWLTIIIIIIIIIFPVWPDQRAKHTSSFQRKTSHRVLANAATPSPLTLAICRHHHHHNCCFYHHHRHFHRHQSSFTPMTLMMMTMMIWLKLAKSFQMVVTFLCEKFEQDCASFATDCPSSTFFNLNFNFSCVILITLDIGIIISNFVLLITITISIRCLVGLVSLSVFVFCSIQSGIARVTWRVCIFRNKRTQSMLAGPLNGTVSCCIYIN